MLLSKANLYEETDQMISFYARAFTHPARLAILRTLRFNGPKTVYELAREHPLCLSAISQHLEILRELELVDFKIYHPFLLYSINEETYEVAKNCLIDFFN